MVEGDRRMLALLWTQSAGVRVCGNDNVALGMLAKRLAEVPSMSCYRGWGWLVVCVRQSWSVVMIREGINTNGTPGR